MADEEITPIKTQFEIIRVQTMASGAVRVVLEAEEHRTDLLQIFADIRRGGGILETAMLPIIPYKQRETDDEMADAFPELE